MHADFKTEMWKNTLKKLPSLEKLKEVLKVFAETDFSKNTAEEIERVYFKKINLYPGINRSITSAEVNTLKLYRVRTNINTEKENIKLLSTFSYPSSSICNCNGRANVPNHPVFYCSDNLMTSFLEVKPKPNDMVFVSYWRVLCDRDSNFYPMLSNNLSPNNLWKPFSDTMYEQLVKSAKEVGEDKEKELTLLYNVFAYWFGTESEPYSKTSWFSNKCLYKTNGIDFIVYPSFATQQQTCSIAIHPNFVDNFMRLEKVVCFKVREFELLRDSIGCNLRLDVNRIGKPSLTNIDWIKPTKEDIAELEKDLIPR